jgi:WbqC-like protein family
MIVSIHQPAYLPWLGYFDRIAASDLFIFLDVVQFEKNSYINRNRIKTVRGPIWLTVPVLLRGHKTKTLTEIEIDERGNWRRKHLRSIEQNYRQTPGFTKKFKLLEAQFPSLSKLTEFCFEQLKFWLVELQIKTKVLRASELPASGAKSDLVLSLCTLVGATTYLSGPLGRGYLNEHQFLDAGIGIRYHNYKHPKYSQLYGEFIPAMAIVDYWMNCPAGELFKENK